MAEIDNEYLGVNIPWSPDNENAILMRSRLSKLSALARKQWGGLLHLLAIPDDWVEEQVGKARKEMASPLDFLNDNEHKDYRYHNDPMFWDVAAGLWSISKTVSEGITPADPRFATTVLKHAQSGEGQNWARENPGVTEFVSKTGLSPWWLAGPVFRYAQTPFIKNQVNLLADSIAVIRRAKSSQERWYEATRIYGGPLGTNSSRSPFFRAVLDKNTPEEAARYLYSQGYRSGNAWEGYPREVKEGLRHIIHPFFRHNSLYSSDVQDMAIAKDELKEAISYSWGRALDIARDAYKGLTQAELQEIPGILAQTGVPRMLRPHDVAEYVEFVANKMILEGTWKGPKPTPDSIRAAAVAAREMRFGWKPGTAFFGERPGEVVGEEIVGKIKAGGFYPRTIRKIMDDGAEAAAKNAPPTSDKFRGWREFRKYEPGISPNIEDHVKAIAWVKVREKYVDSLDAFRKLAKERLISLEKLRSASEKAGDAKAVARFTEDINDVTLISQSIEGWATTASGIKEKGGIPLAVWDGISSGIKTFQLGLNPAWHFKNAFDSLGTKNFISSRGELFFDGAGSLGGRLAPMKRITGGLLEFPGGKTSAIEMGAGEQSLSGASEQMAREVLARWKYNDEVKKALDLGVSPAIADKYAYDAALKKVTDTHYDYNKMAAGEEVLKRVFPYWKYYFENAKYYIRAALNHPAEAAFLLKTYDLQNNTLSFDGKGNLVIPGQDASADPMQLISYTKTAKNLAMPGLILDPANSLLGTAIKLGEVVGGPMAPVLEQALSGLGQIKDASWKGAIPQVNVLKSLAQLKEAKPPTPEQEAQYIAGNEERPVDFSLLAGLNQSQAEYRDWQIRKEMAAAQADGGEKTQTQAAHDVDWFNAFKSVLGFATGIFVNRATPGHVKLERDIKSYVNDFKDSEASQSERQTFRAMKPWLNGIVPVHIDTPDKMIQLIKQLEQDEDALPRIQLELKEQGPSFKSSLLRALPTELYTKVKDALSQELSQFSTGGEASAAEPKQEDSVTPPPGDPSKPWRVSSNGLLTQDTPEQFVEKMKTGTVADAKAIARDQSYWLGRQNKAAKLKTVSQVADFIKSTAGFESVLRARVERPVNAVDQGMAQAYLNVLEDPYGSRPKPQQVEENRKIIQQAWLSTINSSSSTAIAQSIANPKDGAALAASIRTGVPQGTDLSALDDPAIFNLVRLKMAQSIEISLSRLGKRIEAGAQQQLRSDPISGPLLEILSDRVPSRIPDRISQVQQALVAAGADPVAFWEKYNTAFPRRMGEITVGSEFKNYQVLRSMISFHNPQTQQAVGIDPDKLLAWEHAYPDQVPFLLAAGYHGYFGKDDYMRQQLDKYGWSLSNDIDPLTLEEVFQSRLADRLGFEPARPDNRDNYLPSPQPAVQRPDIRIDPGTPAPPPAQPLAAPSPQQYLSSIGLVPNLQVPKVAATREDIRAVMGTAPSEWQDLSTSAIGPANIRPTQRFTRWQDPYTQATRNTAAKNSWAMEYEKANNLPEGSIPRTNVFLEAKSMLADPDGKPTMDPQTMVGLANNLFSLGRNIGLISQNEKTGASRILGGAATGFAAAAAVTQLIGWAGAGVAAGAAATGSALGMGASIISVAGPIGIVAGAGLGIAYALGAFDKDGDGGAADRDHAATVRRNEQQAQIAAREAARIEATRQQSVRDVVSRARTLNNALRDPNTRALTQQAIARTIPTYQRRPQYSYRLGLIDQVTRDIAPHLKPVY